MLALGDVHGRVDAVARVVAEHASDLPDVVVLTGDVAPELDGDGDPEREALHAVLRLTATRAIAATLARLGCPIVVVPGNHDSPALDGAEGLTNVDLLGRAEPRHLLGIQFAGIGGAPAAPYFSRHSWDDSALGAFLDEVALDDVTVLISHTPPLHAALELAPNEEPFFASRSLAEFIDRAQQTIRVCISGHLHRKSGAFQIGNAVVVCCGALCPARAHAPIAHAPLQTPLHPELEQHFVIDIDADGVTVTHRRRCPPTAEALPPLTARFARAAAEHLRV